MGFYPIFRTICSKVSEELENKLFAQDDKDKPFENNKYISVEEITMQ